MLYFIVGFIVVWGVLLLASLFVLYLLVYAVAYAVRGARILSYVGKAKDKPYWLCLWLVFLNTFGDGPASTSYNGRYFPLWAASYYPEWDEDED